MLVHACSVLAPLGRALTTSCSEFASRRAPASMLCMQSAPQNLGKSRLPQHALHAAPFDEWRAGAAAALAVYLCCCIHRIHFAIFQGKLLFEVDFLFFFFLREEKLITTLVSVAALKIRNSQELRNVRMAFKNNISKCQVNVLWEQCDSRTRYEHQIVSAATRTCGIL